MALVYWDKQDHQTCFCLNPLYTSTWLHRLVFSYGYEGNSRTPQAAEPLRPLRVHSTNLAHVGAHLPYVAAVRMNGIVLCTVWIHRVLTFTGRHALTWPIMQTMQTLPDLSGIVKVRTGSKCCILGSQISIGELWCVIITVNCIHIWWFAAKILAVRDQSDKTHSYRTGLTANPQLSNPVGQLSKIAGSELNSCQFSRMCVSSLTPKLTWGWSCVCMYN